jgi:transcriptional regulator with XRE-family HTH domain
VDSIDPAFFNDDTVRTALAARDVGTVYRLLQRIGVTQRRIAGLTGQSQSEVNEILHQGRRVLNVEVLERIADGLGVPREWMGVGYGQHRPQAPVVEEDEIVIRRGLLTGMTAAALRQELPGVGESVEPFWLPGRSVPSRVGMVHVQIVRWAIEDLRGMARRRGGQAEAFVEATRRYTPWLGVPASEVVTAELEAALSELYTEAGWACYDSGEDGRGCFTRALRLADTAKDPYGVANAALHAGATLVRSGHPNDALKVYQLGKFHLRLFPPRRSSSASVPAEDFWVPILTAQLNRQSATAYAVMKGADQADRYLGEADEAWEPQHAFQRAGADLVAAGIQLDLGRLEAAEQCAARAAGTYGEGHHRRGRIEAELIVAEVNVRAGESRGLELAHQAITRVSTLQSVAARRERLIPLATALQARPGSDTQELARLARQVAATRI